MRLTRSEKAPSLDLRTSSTAALPVVHLPARKPSMNVTPTTERIFVDDKTMALLIVRSSSNVFGNYVGGGTPGPPGIVSCKLDPRLRRMCRHADGSSQSDDVTACKDSRSLLRARFRPFRPMRDDGSRRRLEPSSKRMRSRSSQGCQCCRCVLEVVPRLLSW